MLFVNVSLCFAQNLSSMVKKHFRLSLNQRHHVVTGCLPRRLQRLFEDGVMDAVLQRDRPGCCAIEIQANHAAFVLSSIDALSACW